MRRRSLTDGFGTRTCRMACRPRLGARTHALTNYCQTLLRIARGFSELRAAVGEPALTLRPVGGAQQTQAGFGWHV